MPVSRALAGHGIVDTGSSGGGDTLLIILGVAILFGLFYMARKRIKRRDAAPGTDDETQGTPT